MTPGDEASFDTGRVRSIDDDDDLMPAQRGSRAGMWIALLALLVIGGAAGAMYMFVFKQDKTKVAKPPADAAPVAAARPVRRCAAVAADRRLRSMPRRAAADAIRSIRRAPSCRPTSRRA